jgi:hypothetical protein
VLLVLALTLVGSAGTAAFGQAADQPAAAPAGGNLPGPGPMPQVTLGPVLPTVAVRKTAPAYNWTAVDTTVLPRDPQSIWVLDFSFMPVRIETPELNGKRRKVLYMYYRVVNHTGKPRMFVPQFTLITDTGQRKEESVLPQVVKVIQSHEDPTIPLLGAVQIVGMIPPSTKEGIDDAVFGVALWEGVDEKAGRFSVFVKGLSDGHQVVTPPQGGAPVVKYKTVRIDFVRRGDGQNFNQNQIERLDPPYEWIYW